MTESWTRTVRLHEIARGPMAVHLEAGADERSIIAKRLGLRRLDKLVADVVVKPWLDGAEIAGRFDAMVEQACSVSLEPFHQAVAGDIFLRVVPSGSPHAAPEPDAGGELELDLDAPDPPDVLDADVIDLAAYLVEHLALEIDPFPRKPGASFEFEAPTEDLSPFAALKKLQDPKA